MDQKPPMSSEEHAETGGPLPLIGAKPEPTPEKRRFFVAKVNHGYIIADSEEVGVRRVRWAFSEFQELVEFLEAEWGLVPPKPETEVDEK